MNILYIVYYIQIYYIYTLYIYIYSTTRLLQVRVAARPGRTSRVSSSSAHSQLCPLTTPDVSEMKRPAKNPTAQLGKTLLKNWGKLGKLENGKNWLYFPIYFCILNEVCMALLQSETKMGGDIAPWYLNVTPRWNNPWVQDYKYGGMEKTHIHI